MIIKYGTSESATIIETKNVPSWVAQKPSDSAVAEAETQASSEDKEEGEAE
jgi:hypothetical protein